MSTTLSTRIRAVLFDWGDTLIRPPGITTDPEGHLRCVEEFFYAELAPALGPADRRSLSWSRFRPLYEQATMEQIRLTLTTGREHSFRQRLVAALELAGATAPDAATCETLADALGKRIAGACVPIERAAAVLPHLRAHLRLGLLSNYPHAPAVRGSLAEAGLIEHLDAVVISAEIGWSKPSRSAFEAAIAALETPAGEILFVGDDLDNDMRGAKAMGMHTAWLPRADTKLENPEDCIDLKLESLADLVELVAHVNADDSDMPWNA